MTTQQTLSKTYTFSGVGIHSGDVATIILEPLQSNSGIVFSLPSKTQTVLVPAHHKYILGTELAMVLGKAGTQVRTVEHLLSAFSGLEIDNVLVRVEGPEIPVMDGSAAAFVNPIWEDGLVALEAERHYCKIVSPVIVKTGTSSAGVYPADHPEYQAQLTLKHGHAAIQTHALSLTPTNYMQQIAPARTFGWVSQLKTYQENGFARGASTDNAIGIHDDGSIANAEGLRYANECVRHKLLDAIGDMSLFGMPLWGCYKGIDAGHRLHSQLLAALVRSTECYEVTAQPSVKYF